VSPWVAWPIIIVLILVVTQSRAQWDISARRNRYERRARQYRYNTKWRGSSRPHN
jgi:hypothetical protein